MNDLSGSMRQSGRAHIGRPRVFGRMALRAAGLFTALCVGMSAGSAIAPEIDQTVRAYTAYARGSGTAASAGVGSILNPSGSLTGTAISDEKKSLNGALLAQAGAASSADDASVPAEGEDAARAETEDGSETGGISASSSRTADLVMVNVNTAMNVRTSPSEDAEKAGVLYKDCGGRIIERRDGWTKLSSGDLIGWAKDDYLLFGHEAEELAAEVGVELVSSREDAVAIRAEADESSDVVAVLTRSGVVDMLEDLGNGWVSVTYNDEICYIQAEYVEVDFRIDAGETMEVIKAREEEEAKRKAAALAAKGILSRESDETRLLAALIQCEAGNQPYDGKVAVGSVVMNRVHSGAYANTIYGVIYASGQFTPARNGALAKRYNGKIMDSCIQAAQAAMAGESPVGGACHFRRVGSHEGGIVIADHVFW